MVWLNLHEGCARKAVSGQESYFTAVVRAVRETLSNALLPTTLDNSVDRSNRTNAGERAARGRTSDGRSGECSGQVANGKVAGTNDLYGELLLFKLGLTEESASLQCLHILMLKAWPEEQMPRKWKYAVIEMVTTKRTRTNEATIAPYR